MNTSREKVDLFKEAIIEVCRQHQMWISHEDTHGAFVIVGPEEETENWLRAAYWVWSEK